MEIIVSHNNTDFDGLASMIAAKKLFPDAELVYSGKLHRNVREFMSLHKDTFNFRLARDINFNEVTRLILVDTKGISRIGEVREVLENPGIEVLIYDHHPATDDDIKGSFELIENVGAATTLLVEIMKEQGLAINPFEATVFALGIYEDTDCLTFTSTTSRDAEAVAYLLLKGAKLPVVSEFIDRPLSEQQKNLLNKLIVASESYDINGVKILITSGEIDEYVGGLALLLHKMVDVSNVDVAIAVVHMDDRVHIVGRSQDRAVDVSRILAGYNGGGHAMAASATVKDGKVETIIDDIKTLLKANVTPEVTAENIMSAPVKTVTLDTTIEEAGKILLRYGHTGLPVVDGEKMVGIISRRDIDKAKHHGLGHAPVKGFMSRRVITISGKTTLPEIQHLMIDHNIGRLPIINKGRIEGIVSRTDVLRSLHGEHYPGKYERIYNISQAADNSSDNLKNLMTANLSRPIRDMLSQISYLADREGCQVFVVGGFVRDLILGVENFDIDLVVEGDGPGFARSLAQFLCGRVRVHDKFGTAMVILDDNFRIDVATARTEYYEYPAALPKVEVSSLKQDLYRRDFTINAMAVTLSAKNFGKLVDYFGGRRDLEEGIIRVLYNLSFVEDPTRILRAVRFEQRYGFKIETQTLSLVKRAIKGKMLAKLSADRVREELKHILSEASPTGSILRMCELNIWPFILPDANTGQESLEIIKRLPPAMEFVRCACGYMKLNSWILYLGLLLRDTGCQISLIDEKLRITKEEQKKLIELLCLCPEVIINLSGRQSMKMSQIASVVRELSGEGFAFILAVSTADLVNERVKEYLTHARDNKLLINGEDIKELGYKPAPFFKEALDAVGEARLDGAVVTKDEEINFVSEFLERIGAKKTN
ncbi:CBS domain-containing protein [Phosphitispora sp. TUW77]|uniref:CBS domain-containing protein n=1 Tax=Phosphitispora sp. TUW77 TaxID=3152361 RepID=UPI003AB3979A